MAIQQSILEQGGIAPLLALLNGVSDKAQVSAAEALSNVARSNVDTQTEIARAGGIGPLLAIVTSRNPHAQAHDDP